jgi:ubiquitin carboxyl-terminal hydrolase 8
MTDNGFVVFVLRGLPNLGATCYLNSILQILCNIPELRQKRKIHSSNPDEDANKVCDGYEGWLNAHTSEASTLSENAALTTFIKTFITYYSNFGSGMQDQHEYLMLLLKIMHDCRATACIFRIQGTKKGPLDWLEEKALKNMRKDGMWTSFNNLTDKKENGWNSSVFQTFTGQYHFQTTCSKCNYVSHRFEIFRSFEVELCGGTEKGMEPATVDIDDCLRKVIRPTQLDSDNCYECDRCKKQNQSIRKMMVWRLPSVLILVLKRFTTVYVNGNITVSKNTKTVTVPDTLDMSPYMSYPNPSSSMYELFATANHIGTPQGGHCFSYVKSPAGKWYIADDNNIQEINKQGSLSGAEPYILFYRKNKDLNI